MAGKNLKKIKNKPITQKNSGKEKNNKKLIGILVAAAIIIIILLGFFLLKNKGNNKVDDIKNNVSKKAAGDYTNPASEVLPANPEENEIQNDLIHKISASKSGSGKGIVSSSPAGINCGADCSEDYSNGTIVRLSAEPDEGSAFVEWRGDCSGDGECIISLDSDKSVTAVFDEVPSYTLGVAKAGTGTGTVSSSPAGINCGADCAGYYSSDIEITLSAEPDEGSAFVEWRGDCSGDGECIISLDSDKSVTAVFDEVPFYTLSAAKAGTGTGTVSSSPAGINCGADCSEDYLANTEISLSIISGSGSVFSGWSGCDSVTEPNICHVTLSNAKSVTATFNRVYTLSVVKNGAGNGRIMSEPVGINCGTTCSYGLFQSGELVVLQPIVDAGSIFENWVACDAVSGSMCQVLMNSDKEVYANFRLA